MIKTIIQFLKKLLIKEQQMAFLPTPFDAHPEPFTLINNFLEKEFYLLMYQMIENPPTVDSSKYYKKSYISFILMFAYTITQEKENNVKEKDILKIKSIFYEKLVRNVITKISFHLKVIFYRYYNMNSIPKISIIQSEKYRDRIKRLEFLAKINPKLHEKVIMNLTKIFIDISMEEDKELVDYILNWTKIKFDIISTEIILLKEKILNEDPIFSILKNYPLDWWGELDLTKGGIGREKEIMDLQKALNGRIECYYFVTNLNKLFTK